jgi:hypothetical protein
MIEWISLLFSICFGFVIFLVSLIYLIIAIRKEEKIIIKHEIIPIKKKEKKVVKVEMNKYDRIKAELNKK